MNLIATTSILINEIFSKKSTLNDIFKVRLKQMNLSSNEIILVKAALKGLVNHYYYLAFQIDEKFASNSAEEKMYLTIALAFLKYVKGMSGHDVLVSLNEVVLDKKLQINVGEANTILNALKDIKREIPENYQNNFNKKLSLLYSFPEWIVGMLRKHFGSNNAYKIIAQSRTGNHLNLTYNAKTYSEEELLKDADFEKNDTIDKCYNYLGESNALKNKPQYKNYQAYVIDASEVYLSNILSIQENDQILLLGNKKINLMVNIALQLSNYGKLFYGSNDKESYFNARSSAHNYNLGKNIFAFEGDYPLICTHVGEGTCDKVICYPSSSSLGQIARKPEILLSLQQDDLDTYIKNQQDLLNESAKYVKDDGKLVYAVATLNKKESFLLVRDFLTKHPEFFLSEEKLLFPHIYQSSGLYYAIIKKKQIGESHD